MAQIITEYLNKISSKVFEKYSSLINDLIHHKHGIYALYKKDRLYYVGKAVNLKNRIKQHLQDKHSNKWDTFSLFVIRNGEYINGIESILIAINSPRGNKLTPQNHARNLKKQLAQLMTDYNKQDVNKILCIRKDSIRTCKTKTSLQKYKQSSYHIKCKNAISIFADYKGIRYVAILNEDYTVIYRNELFNSLSAAAKAITKCHWNGRLFWKVEDEDGELITINAYQARRKRKGF